MAQSVDHDSSFEELAMTSFQELEKVNEEKISSSDLQKLLERTRQRRELLNQKLGKTPEVTPRKRILEQNIHRENTSSAQENKEKDGSPGKRQCLREDENNIKPDTPAIPSVKSRLGLLSQQREDWSANDGIDVNQSAPGPTPAVTIKDVDNVKENMEVTETVGSKMSRRGRLAHLAQTINTWEDDLSHPVIKKPEEKKPRWQPPKAENVVGDGPPKPPRFQGTEERVNTSNVALSPVKAHNPGKSPAPAPPPSSSVAPSPKKITSALPPVWSPSKGGNQQNRSNLVNAKGVNENETESMKEEPTVKPVSNRLASWKKSDTPQKPIESKEDTLSARLASWEQKAGTPARATTNKVQLPIKQVATPLAEKPKGPSVPEGPGAVNPDISMSDPAAQPVASRMATWQQRVSQSTPVKEEEPTAYSVNARMSAWEEMSSANKVSYIKKVDPGSAGSNPSPKKSPVKGVGKSPVKVIGQGVTPSKVVKDNIIERAAHIQSAMSMAPRSESVVTPAKVSGTPGKVGSATKMMQQRLLEQAQHSKTDDLADKLRKDRMAELQTLQNRYQNGVLKEDRPKEEESMRKSLENRSSSGSESETKETTIAKSKAGEQSGVPLNSKQYSKESSEELPPKCPTSAKKSSYNQAHKPPSGSLYRLISQKRADSEKPDVQGSTKQSTTNRTGNSVPCIDDSFDSTEDDELFTHKPLTSTEEETESESNIETQEDSYEESDVGYQETEKSASIAQQPYQPPLHVLEESDDDVSFSAFVPESVRRKSVLPAPPSDDCNQQKEKICSKPPHDPVASVPSSCRNNSQTRLVGYASSNGQTSSSSLDSASSSQSSLHQKTTSTDSLNTTGEEEGDEDIGDFLEEAYSEEEDMKPKAAPRKRRSHMMATSTDQQGLVYSVSAYRSRRNQVHFHYIDDIHMDNAKRRRRYLHDPPCAKSRIVRNREFESHVEEEKIEMPTQLPPDLERKSIQERIQELQELVSQEQTVIMQTSNALNQCCSGNSYFHGSPEQVECNRVLLLACQKRQAYMMEIQRLKDTRCLDPPGSGPKGSLTISDIRLPLKKEFVTKIGTSNDNTVHYFLILIRNYSQVIVTQMLSTHDPMMRGSMDFPNLIKIHGIHGDFKLTMEIYSMSVSRENVGKDKKRKTPKKATKGQTTIAPSPGGPHAVRTTNFTLITTLPLTMRSLDKNCFTLERIPYLSPLHGTIYMRLKCLMEQNVEERGFLTMFEDVSGLGAWHRRWIVLAGNKLCFWKYPDDENKKEPMGYIDLKRCVTEKVGLIPRDICARPNTFEMVTVRQPRKGEPDTLVTKTYNTMTTVKHMLSADTKEERINWCNKINRALANIRTWHSDAMRPIKVQAKA